MFRLSVVIFLILCAAATCIDSAKILGVFHMPAYSHFQLGDKILKALAANGHEVTVISPYIEKKNIKNFKQVILTGLLESGDERKQNLFEEQSKNTFQSLLMVEMFGLYFAESTLNHTNVQKFLQEDHHFDIVITEQFVNEAFRGFCYKYNAHCIVLSTVGPSRWSNLQMGNPGNPSYVPDLFLSYESNMNFCERVWNTIIYTSGVLLNQLYFLPKHNELIQKHFPGAPSLNELYYNTSLMLVNYHVSTNSPVPLVPNMISIGGFHVNPPKPLPKDLQEFLDNSKDGVILFSMGSNLKSRDMPADTRNAILRSFSKLKQNVLWKWEDENLPNKPANVKISKWLPQQDILAHPNIKLFITHGGLLSTIETIYYGVPVIGIPIFGDQELNVANAENSGYALKVPYKELNEERLSSALKEILNNPKYGENAKRRSKIMHDEPMKPLDKAMFWIDYVLRHNGAPHLRTAALNLNWYQYLLLDVLAVAGGLVVLSWMLLCKLFRCICCRKKTLEVVVTKGKKKN